jgi:Ca2+/Na+ antiporter
MFDWIFSFIHLLVLLGALGYAFYFLFQGNVSKFIIIIGLITAYYLIVLHKAVKKEIERKRKKKN